MWETPCSWDVPRMEKGLAARFGSKPSGARNYRVYEDPEGYATRYVPLVADGDSSEGCDGRCCGVSTGELHRVTVTIHRQSPIEPLGVQLKEVNGKLRVVETFRGGAVERCRRSYEKGCRRTRDRPDSQDSNPSHGSSSVVTEGCRDPGNTSQADGDHVEYMGGAGTDVRPVLFAGDTIYSVNGIVGQAENMIAAFQVETTVVFVVVRQGGIRRRSSSYSDRDSHRCTSQGHENPRRGSERSPGRSGGTRNGGARKQVFDL